MIVVAVVSILAAIAIPAFVEYMRRSKTSEAPSNLKTLFLGAAAYYGATSWANRGVVLGPGLVDSSACTVGAATTSNLPYSGKTILDLNIEDPAFSAISFEAPDPLYYQYAIAGSVDACGHVAGTDLYSFRARGNLDGDGVFSLFEISAGSSSTNALMRTPGVYRERELE